MLKRIYSLIVKEFIHLINDWWMPAFMLIGGVMELMLVAWATSRPMTNLPLMVLDQDQSASSRAVIVALENTGTFALKSEAPDLETIENALERGQINAAVVIPPDFDNQMASAVGHPTLSILLNGAESIPARAYNGKTVAEIHRAAPARRHRRQTFDDRLRGHPGLRRNAGDSG